MKAMISGKCSAGLQVHLYSCRKKLNDQLIFGEVFDVKLLLQLFYFWIKLPLNLFYSVNKVPPTKSPLQYTSGVEAFLIKTLCTFRKTISNQGGVLTHTYLCIV